MATYVVEKDALAGWESSGRKFGIAGVTAAAVAFICWAAMRGPAYGSAPAPAFSGLFLSAMVWVGGGVFFFMTILVLESILRSREARGIVTIDDEGVLRQIGARTRLLTWGEIAGYVFRSGGGVTLVSREANRQIKIPRSLDDYRGCLSELRARKLEVLPESRLNQSTSRKVTWWEGLRIYVGTTSVIFAFDRGLSPRARIVSLALGIAMFLWLTIDEKRWKESGWPRWLYLPFYLGAVEWIEHLLAHHH